MSKDNDDAILEATAHKKPDGSLDAVGIAKCKICKQWQAICFSEPNTEESDIIKKWYADKKSFWEGHQAHLESNGQSYTATITKALDNLEVIVSANTSKNLEGCLLIVKVGSKEHPPAQVDIQKTYNLMNELFKEVKGVRVLVTTPDFNIEKISLPQLRNLQSAVLTSVEEPDENYNPALRDIEL